MNCLLKALAMSLGLMCVFFESYYVGPLYWLYR